MLADYSKREIEARRLVQRVVGRPIPETLFPAVITGYAIARVEPVNQGGTECSTPGIGCSRPWPNSPFVEEVGCEDDGGLDDCSPSSPVDSRLPCGVEMVRYKWISPATGLSSVGCGYRKNEAGDFIRWKQALYAVNTAHKTQDAGIDYPFVPVNMLVQMAFGKIGAVSGGVPEFGFFFHHMSDPPGANLCVDETECGCCIGYDPNFPAIPVGRDCRTLANCVITWEPGGFNYEWFQTGSPEYQACVVDQTGTYSCDDLPCFGA